MRKFYHILWAVIAVMLTSVSASAQKNYFNDITESSIRNGTAKRLIIPDKYRTIGLKNDELKSFLWSLPSEKNILASRINAPVMLIPMPDGTMARFNVWESSIQEPALEAHFPEIKTFAGQGIDDPYASIRFDYNPYFGFSAQILSASTGRIYIDAYAKGDVKNYISYYHKDNNRNAKFQCRTIDERTGDKNGLSNRSINAGPCRGTELITYRLAVACTGEYAVTAGSPGATHARIVTTVNRVTQVYETDLSIRLVLVGNNNLIEFQDPATDPYANDGSSAGGNSDLGKNTGVINNAIGSANYDIGHLFCTNESGGVGAGVAGVAVVCTGSKGRGLTGRANPTGDGYDIDYVAHEMGHQFGADHTFNTNTCFGGAPAGGSYEPGGGTTIMAYAGICGSTENIQPNSDPVFHAKSFDDISTFVTSGSGASCGARTATGNTLPVITAMDNNGISIPVRTPFTLTASATDADGDPITYLWEGWDIGAAGSWPSAATSTTRPLFRTRVPQTNGSRTFPDIRVIAANYPGTAAPSAMDGLRGEVLPEVARAMKFRLTVRDNHAGGGGVTSGGNGCGAFSAPFIVNAVGTSPFAVTIPNGSESYAGNTSQTVTWNVVGTNAAPFNVSNVKISLSTDGGLTYPIVLSASTANDGTEAITLPATATTTARVKVEAIGNIFFDISNANFTITAPVNDFILGTPVVTAATCPASTASATIPTSVSGSFVTPIVLTATAGVPAGTNVTFSPNPLTPGATATVTLNNATSLTAGTYPVTITGTAGATVHTVVVNYVISQSAPPTLTGPAAQIVCEGIPATFGVTSSVVPTSYQWQVSTAAVPAFTNIAGATSATYTIAATTAAQNGNQYRVIVNTQCASATSAAALLTVQASPAITAQPQSIIVCDGTNATFSVTATGAGLGYQWQQSIDNGFSFQNISGATAATYTVTGVTAGQSGYQYRVNVQGTCLPAVTTSAAILTVGDAAAITTGPSNSTVCVGANASFSVVATGSNLTYQWQVSTAAVPAFTDISGATASTYTITGATAAQSGNQYRVVVFSCTPTGINSTAATLTVNTPVAIGTQPVASTVCSGATATFSVAATGTNLSYQWQYAATCAGTFNNLSGETAATLSLANVGTPNAGAYRVAVTGACGTVNSSCVLLTVNVPVTISAQPTDFSICLPVTGTVNGSFTVAAAGTALAYQWQVSTVAAPTFVDVAGATSATLTLTNLTAAMNGNKYRAVLSGTCTPSLISAVANLTVNTPVNISAQPQSKAICSGDNTSFAVTATGSTITYQWQVNINGGPYINVNNGGIYSGATTNTLTLTNVTTLNNGYKYRVVVSGVPCGAVNSSEATLTVNQTPTVELSLKSYSNITPYIRTALYPIVSPAAGPYTYAWYKNGNLLNGVGTSPLPVSVDDLGTYTVRATNSVTGCFDISDAVTLSDSASNILFVYPNPSSGKFEVRYYNRGGASHTRTLSVYDAKGGKVFKQQFTLTGVYAKMPVDLSAAGSGVYYIDLSDGAGKRIASGRVVIKR